MFLVDFSLFTVKKSTALVEKTTKNREDDNIETADSKLDQLHIAPHHSTQLPPTSQYITPMVACILLVALHN